VLHVHGWRPSLRWYRGHRTPSPHCLRRHGLGLAFFSLFQGVACHVESKEAGAKQISARNSRSHRWVQTIATFFQVSLHIFAPPLVEKQNEVVSCGHRLLVVSSSFPTLTCMCFFFPAHFSCFFPRSSPQHTSCAIPGMFSTPVLKIASAWSTTCCWKGAAGFLPSTLPWKGHHQASPSP